MLFHHEEVERRIKQFNKDLVAFKKQAESYNRCYDIAIAWKENDQSRYTNFYGHYVTMYLVEADKLQVIQDFLDELEETVLYGWEMDVDGCYSSASEHTYRYKNEKTFVVMCFHNSNCKQIKTGKMIPETITVCNESF